MMYPMWPILPRMTEEQVARFWSKVDKRGPSECWRFRGANQGYGAFVIRRRTIAAHRVAWVLHNQEELGDRLACHSCDNRWCVNPTHIWSGTHDANNKDTAAKGRHRNGTSYTEITGGQRAAKMAAVPPGERTEVAAVVYAAERINRKG